MGLQIKFALMSLLLILLAGCGGDQTTAQLEISTSYISTGTFGGGFMVIGESSTGKKFSVAMFGTNQTKIKLEAGTWKFAAVGWEGAGTSKPFEGTPYCGGLSDFNLSEQNATINLDITSTNCASPLLQASIQLKPTMRVLGCDIFYSYNPDTDTFTPVPKEHSLSFCNKSEMIADYVTKFEKFRVSALAITSPTDIKPAFTSDCKTLSTDTMALPAGKFPFTISLYKNEADCLNQRAAQTYNFFYGLSEGNPVFDSTFSPGTQGLLLATSKTKRGRSPFMTEIPRINCGTYPALTDCMAEPAPASHIKVEFNKHKNHYVRQVLLKNINPLLTSCPATLLSQSKFFENDSCEVDERTVRIEPYRNEFMCQSSTQTTSFFPVGHAIKDIHQKGNHIYFLKYDGTNTIVSVYTNKGRYVHDLNLGPLSGGYAVKMAVSGDGKKMVLANTSKIFFYSLDGGGYTPGITYTMTVEDIELNATGSFFYTLVSGSVEARSMAAPATAQTSITLTNPITDLKFLNGFLYILENNPMNPDYIHKAPVTDGTLGTPLLVFGNAANFEFFDVIGNKLVVFSTGTYHVKDLVSGTETPGISHTGSGISVPAAGTIVKDKILLASTSKIRMLDIQGTTNVALLTGTCSEPLTVSFGGVTKALTIEAKENQPLDMLFRDGLDMLGRRFFADLDKPFYYFQSLAHNDDRTTGGELRRVQEMLSPQAIGAFFSEFPTCADVVAATPFTKSQIFRDETTGETMGFTLKVSKSTDAMDSYICSSAVGSCPSSPNNLYDLNIEFEKNTGDYERMKIKLKCGKEIGSFESIEVEPGRTSRERYLYYTETDNQARFEKYSFDIEDETRAEVLKVYKTDAETVKARKVQVSVNMSQYKHASVTELHRTSTYIFENKYDINASVANFHDSNSSVIFPYTGVTFDEARDNFEMASNAESQVARTCTTVSNGNLNGTNEGSCTFTDFESSPLSLGSGITLRPAVFDIENTPNIMSTGVFEIP